MGALLADWQGLFTQQTLNTLGAALNLEPARVREGMMVVGPLLHDGLAQAAATPQGAEQLAALLAQLPAAWGIDPVGSLLSSTAGASPADNAAPDLIGEFLSGAVHGNPLTALLDSAFGGGLGAIGRLLRERLGFDLMPLISAGLPLLLGLLKQRSNAQPLASDALARLLADEQRAFAASDAPNVALVQEASTIARRAHALHDRFSADEWSAIRLAPLAVVGLIMAAAPSRWAGAAAELGAGVRTVLEARNAAATISLIGLAFDAGYGDDELQAFGAVISKQHALGTLAAAATVVRAKSPDEAPAYTALLRNVGAAVATASKEGGFLGFGGEQVSAAETEILGEIDAVLATPRA